MRQSTLNYGHDWAACLTVFFACRSWINFDFCVWWKFDCFFCSIREKNWLQYFVQCVRGEHQTCIAYCVCSTCVDFGHHIIYTIGIIRISLQHIHASVIKMAKLFNACEFSLRKIWSQHIFLRVRSHLPLPLTLGLMQCTVHKRRQCIWYMYTY